MFFFGHRFAKSLRTLSSDISSVALDAILADDSDSFGNIISDLDNVNYTIFLKGAKLPPILDDGPSLLSLCAFFNSIKCFQLLKIFGADDEATDRKRRNPAHFACAGGSFEIIRDLDKPLSYYETKDYGGLKSVHYAAMFGRIEILKYLWSKGAKLDEIDSSHSQPIHLASLYGHSEVVKFLVQNGISIDTQSFSMKPLHYASICGSISTIQYLISLKIDVNEPSMDGKTPIFYAARFGSLEAVKLLVKHGAIFRYKRRKLSPIIEAAKGGHTDVVNYFLENKCDPNLYTASGETPLLAAIEGKHTETVKLLLSKGALIQSPNQKLPTVHYACVHSNAEIVELLLSRPDFDRNSKEIKSEDLIRSAVENNSLEILKVLSNYGFRAWKSVGKKNSVIEQAIRNKNFEMAKFLIEKGVPCNPTNNGTLLRAIVLSGYVSMLKLMIEKGLNMSKTLIDRHEIHKHALNSTMEMVEFIYGQFPINKNQILKQQSLLNFAFCVYLRYDSDFDICVKEEKTPIAKKMIFYLLSLDFKIPSLMEHYLTFAPFFSTKERFALIQEVDKKQRFDFSLLSPKVTGKFVGVISTKLSKSIDILDFFISHGLNFQVVQFQLMKKAIQTGKIPNIKVLEDKGVGFNYPNSNLIGVAIKKRDPQLIKYVYDKIDYGFVPKYHKTPLETMCRYKDFEKIKDLIENHHVNINATGFPNIASPLYFAKRYASDKPEIIQYLESKKATIPQNGLKILQKTSVNQNFSGYVFGNPLSYLESNFSFDHKSSFQLQRHQEPYVNDETDFYERQNAYNVTRDFGFTFTDSSDYDDEDPFADQYYSRRRKQKTQLEKVMEKAKPKPKKKPKKKRPRGMWILRRGFHNPDIDSFLSDITNSIHTDKPNKTTTTTTANTTSSIPPSYGSHTVVKSRTVPTNYSSGSSVTSVTKNLASSSLPNNSSNNQSIQSSNCRTNSATTTTKSRIGNLTPNSMTTATPSSGFSSKTQSTPMPTQTFAQYMAQYQTKPIQSNHVKAQTAIKKPAYPQTNITTNHVPIRQSSTTKPNTTPTNTMGSAANLQTSNKSLAYAQYISQLEAQKTKNPSHTVPKSTVSSSAPASVPPKTTATPTSAKTSINASQAQNNTNNSTKPGNATVNPQLNVSAAIAQLLPLAGQAPPGVSQNNFLLMKLGEAISKIRNTNNSTPKKK
ncbi:hypothetical protein TRFO_41174 [Tritrichomonas foetus]|uniref:Uncharacterized protein n=1 Tax=Tritrichomonas foetus TaxID=1144522 RepID=A0A1J4L2F0_9EUKA|nr:hypothetical protein TRFO_41174 [Tritrichomonas foetus]|eukprot:OHT17264.1 hypothetical protein TRFO_41174 [Tritrichomonas foetus]